MAAYQTLPNGFKIPSIGFGTTIDPENIEEPLDAALAAGYRHIDTAPPYRTEADIGRILKKWFDSGKLKREDVFITSKVNPAKIPVEEFESTIKKTLADLQTDYLDLYLLHWPADEDNVKFWKKMEEQVDAGRAKYIGVSNFNSSQLDEILKNARIKPVNLQIPLHLYGQQKELVDYCKKNNITVVAYSPLGGKNLGTKMFQDEVIKDIAAKFNKTPAQIALRYSIQRGIVPIPKSTNSERLKLNFNVFDFTLADQDMKQLASIDKDMKGLNKFPGPRPKPVK